MTDKDDVPSPREVLMAQVVFVVGLLALAKGAAAQDGTAPRAIDPAWLSADTASRTATFELIAGLTGVNGALNFNGFRDGGLTLTVPRSAEHTSELQSPYDLVCRVLLE